MKMIQRRFLVTAALLSTVALGACSARSMIRQPEINLTGVSVGGLGLRGGQLIAHLEIANPNSFDVETQSITYDLKVSDRNASGQETWVDFASGTFNEKIQVDDGGRTRVEIPIDFTYSTVGSAIRSIMDRGTFNYRVEGTVALREPLRREVPFKHQGNVSLQGVR